MTKSPFALTAMDWPVIGSHLCDTSNQFLGTRVITTGGVLTEVSAEERLFVDGVLMTKNDAPRRFIESWLKAILPPDLIVFACFYVPLLNREVIADFEKMELSLQPIPEEFSNICVLVGGSWGQFCMIPFLDYTGNMTPFFVFGAATKTCMMADELSKAALAGGDFDTAYYQLLQSMQSGELQPSEVLGDRFFHLQPYGPDGGSIDFATNLSDKPVIEAEMIRIATEMGLPLYQAPSISGATEPYGRFDNMEDFWQVSIPVPPHWVRVG